MLGLLSRGSYGLDAQQLATTAPAEETLLTIVDTAILDGVLRGAGRTAWHYPQPIASLSP